MNYIYDVITDTIWWCTRFTRQTLDISTYDCGYFSSCIVYNLISYPRLSLFSRETI